MTDTDKGMSSGSRWFEFLTKERTLLPTLPPRFMWMCRAFSVCLKLSLILIIGAVLGLLVLFLMFPPFFWWGYVIIKYFIEHSG